MYIVIPCLYNYIDINIKNASWVIISLVFIFSHFFRDEANNCDLSLDSIP